MAFFYNLILLPLSWLLIYLLEKRNILATWLQLTSSRWSAFLKGFFLMAALCVLQQLSLMLLSPISWSISKELNIRKLLYSLFYDLNSVLMEELIFRAVLLYLLIMFIGTKTGILFSAVAFGVYHWFTADVLANMTGMMMVFLVTGSMGWLLATAYASTDSLLLPFGLHLGWNVVNHALFSNGPNGNILLTAENLPAFCGSFPWISFGLYLIVVMIALLFVHKGFAGRESQ